MRQASALASDRTGSARQAALFAQAAPLARFGAWECDLATEALTWTDGVYDLFELSRGCALRRKAIVDLYLDESRARMEHMRAAAIREGGRFSLDAEIRTARGQRRWMRLTAQVACEAGRPIRLFGAKQDVTEEREMWARLRRLAERDPLTGLANRGLFDARYAEVARAGVGRTSVAGLVLVDLDRFKAVNDRFGHAAGDACLREAAMRLGRCFGDAVMVARLGGDEFAVLLRAPLGRLRIVEMLARASRELALPLFWDGRRIDMGASIGAAILDRPYGRDPSKIFAEADAALYAAKAAGRSTVRIFGDEPTACSKQGAMRVPTSALVRIAR